MTDKDDSETGTVDESGMEAEWDEHLDVPMTAATELGEDDVVTREPSLLAGRSVLPRTGVGRPRGLGAAAAILVEAEPTEETVQAQAGYVYVVVYDGVPVAVYDNKNSAAIGSLDKAQVESDRTGEPAATQAYKLPLLS